MVAGSVTPFMDPEVVPVQLRLPVPDPVICILPVALPQLVGFATVPNAMEGVGFTVTVVPVEVAEQPPLVTVTVYVPEVVAVIDCVVAPPGDQTLPLAEDEVSVTLPPEQNVVGPPAEIVGVAGVGFTVTVVPADVAEQPPLVTVTV
jgi:hypothetical protein